MDILVIWGLVMFFCISFLGLIVLIAFMIDGVVGIVREGAQDEAYRAWKASR